MKVGYVISFLKDRLEVQRELINYICGDSIVLDQDY